MRSHDLIILDDVLSNPNELVSYAKTVYYYDENNRSLGRPEGDWRGHRSKTLGNLNYSLFSKVTSEVLNKVFELHKNIKISYTYDIMSNFHYLTKDDIADSSWIHKDNFLYTGVLYLNKIPKENSGTCLYDDSQKLTSVIENKYNRLVLFNSTIPHSAESGFGSNVNDARLSLVMFVNSFSFNCEGN